jgi:hypothetical protein|tara:strand:- start:92 stop:856 length:765 start_codon:yes stop_codon:yes gene_type:complete
MITRKINKVNHPIYSSVEEFRTSNPSVDLVENWREGTEGSWVVSDDGQVCQVLKRGTMSKRAGSKEKNYYIRVPLGTFICGKNITMEGEPRKNLYSFGLANKTVYEHKVEKKKTTQREFLFAQYVAKGEDVVEAFVKAFPTNNKSYAEGQAKILMKAKRIQKLIREEIDKVLSDADITPLYLLEQMRDIVDRRDSHDRDKIQAIKTLMQISGMMDTEKKTESVAVFQGFTKEQLDAIGGGNVKKLASAEREVEV